MGHPGRVLGCTWAHPSPGPCVPTPAAQQWRDLALFPAWMAPGLVHIFPNRRAGRLHLPPEGRLACHKAVSPFQGHAAPPPACSKQKAHRTLGGWWAVGSNVTSPAGSATPRHHWGHRGRPGGSFRWGLGVAGRKRQRAFRVLRAHPGARRTRLTRHGCMGHPWAADHSAGTASGRDPGPPGPRPRGRSPTTHPVLSCRAFQPHVGFPVAKPRGPGA